ncbi:MAG: hypothetical protein JO000_03345 [Alphaproteobacteria bacterium]|nr:hypothetical protein [Alphaproteobacteria bacterium]
MKKWLIGALFVLGCSGPASADFCQEMFLGFAKQLDSVGDRLEPLEKSGRIQEACKFQRSEALPLYRRILATAKANRNRCGAAPVQKAQGHLEKALKVYEKECRGM